MSSLAVRVKVSIHEKEVATHTGDLAKRLKCPRWMMYSHAVDKGARGGDALIDHDDTVLVLCNIP